MITTYTILDVLLLFVITCQIINTQQVFTKEHHQSQEDITVVSSLFIIARQMTMVRAIMIDQNDTSKSRFVAIIRCAF